MAHVSATTNVAESRITAPEASFAMLLFGLMVSVPFLIPYHNLPVPSFQSEWLAMLLGLLGLLPLVLQKEPFQSHVPPIAIAPLALMLVVVLQLASGMFAYMASAFTILIYLLWCALLAVAGRTLVAATGDRRLTTHLAWFLFAGGFVNAVFGLLQYLQLSQVFGGLISEPMPVAVYGIYGNLAQQNHFSTHIALSLVSASYLCFSRQLPSRWYCISALVLLVALIFSGSRSSFLYVAWIIATSIWLMRTEVDSRACKRVAWWAAGVFATIILALYIASCYLTMIPQVERLLTISGALGPRFYLWKHAFAMFLGKPLLGVGFDAFAYHLVGQLQKLNEPIMWGIDQYAHNLWLQLLAVSGLCGFIAVAWPTALFLRRQLLALYTVERLWAWGVLGVLLIHSAFEQPLYYSYFLGVAALVAGMSDPLAWSASLGAKPKVFAAMLLALALAFLAKTANDYDNIDGYFYSGRYFNSEDPSRFDSRRNVVLGLRAHSIFAPLSELISPADFVPAGAPASEKIKLNYRLMRYAPIAEIEFRQAALLAEAGMLPEAMRQFDRAAHAYPSETAQYLGRFNALAANDAATYGQLAAYANELTGGKRDR